MNNEEKIKKIKSILLMPIRVESNSVMKKSGRNVIIDSKNNQILSIAKSKDPDMSFIALEFYKILYDFNDENCFSGDTMNSFNIVSRYASDDKKQDWGKSYHCLANFWVLPKEVGRTCIGELAKASGGRPSRTIEYFNTGKKDFMDRFLSYYFKNFDKYSKEYSVYVDKFPEDSFAALHYIDGIYMDQTFDNDQSIKLFSYIKDEDNFVESVNDVISEMQSRIELRAEKISESDKGIRLFDDLFKKFLKQ